MPGTNPPRILLLSLLLVHAALLNAEDAKPGFFSTPGLVSASGRWKSTSGIAGDEPAHEHAVLIQCRLDIRECYEATALIVAGKPLVDLVNYPVTKWDKNEITAEDNSPICVTRHILINFQEQSVISLEPQKEGAKGMPLGDGRNACQLLNHTQSYKLVASWK